MAFVHGKNAEFELDENDLSEFINDTSFDGTADSHDTTTYGQDAHVFDGGLKNATIDLEGIYDSGTSGPRAVIEPLRGTKVEFAYRPEGAGSGKPEVTGDCVVVGYAESVPVADMVSWTARLQVSGDVTETAQGS